MAPETGRAGASIDLSSPLRLSSAFRFPLQSPDARRELAVGALWLLVPVVGWLMNMGHRIRMVHNMQHGRPAWPAWEDAADLLAHGAITFAGMIFYASPGLACLGAAFWLGSAPLALVGLALLLAAVVAIPGYMSHYCVAFDAREIFDPVRALLRVREGGAAYWRAWGIALSALALSFLGLLALGVGFFFTSVWFWQVAGFAFASVFSRKFGLGARGGRS